MNLGRKTPKQPKARKKARENAKTQQDLNWPCHRDWPQIGQKITIDKEKNQKAREDCGCPKFLAGKVFQQISPLLENSSLIFRQHEMLFLPRFGQGNGCWKIGPGFGNAPGFSPLRPPQPP